MQRRTMKYNKRYIKEQQKLIGWLSITLILPIIIFGMSQLFIKKSEAAKEKLFHQSSLKYSDGSDSISL